MRQPTVLISYSHQDNLSGASSVADGGLLGRDLELQLLDNAWADSKTAVLCVVAASGVGKSALVDEWLNRLAAQAYDDAERVFAWRFSAGLQSETSADAFVDAALRFFGDADPASGTPWQKGERLARLICRKRTLLILDDVEPLQYAAGAEQGRLKDPMLHVLVHQLALSNPGLCVLTSRRPVTDLDVFSRSSVLVLALERLSPEAGAALLQRLGVQGSDQERRQAAMDVEAHALALSLMGHYLSRFCGGDVNRRDELRLAEADEREGSHARQVLRAFERRLDGSVEQAILDLMGLFEDSAAADALAALRAEPIISGLTDGLFWRRRLSGIRGLLGRTEPVPIDAEAWRAAVAGLRDCGFLNPADPEAPDTLDTHPLIREYFSARLQERCPDAWRAGHRRLYEYFQAAPPIKPENLETLLPLYAAVAHGCRAGLQAEVFERVYWRRINRGNEFFSTEKLGAYGIDLAALADFFERTWDQPATQLGPVDRALVLTGASLRLRTLGRLDEAMEAIRAGRDLNIGRERWKSAAIQAGNLSELALLLGDVATAVRCAEQSVALADRAADAFQQMGQRVRLGDALHQAGRLNEAESMFREAEAMQEKRQPQFPLLYSVQGFLYCDLLLSQGQAMVEGEIGLIKDMQTAGGAAIVPIGRELALGRFREVQRRVAQTLEWVTRAGRVLDIALDLVTLGRAMMLEAIIGGSRDLAQALSHLNQAVHGLRQLGSQDHLPSALLARAALHCEIGEWRGAESDLGEVLELATRSRMRLYVVDVWLGIARLHLARGARNEARICLERAVGLIERMGYHRRDGEAIALKRLVSPDADQ